MLFINSGEWIGLLTFLDMPIDKVFAALKFTSQKSAQSLMQVTVEYHSRCLWRFDDNVQSAV